MSVFTAINRDIWIAFQRAYDHLDLEGFLAIYGPELVRVESGARWIGNREQYGERTGSGFARAAAQGDRLAIDFRFHDRLATTAIASERGVYRVSITATGGEEQVFHGRFHCVSRCTTERWRVIVDYDDDDGGAVSSDDFAAGHSLDDTAPFDM